MFGLNRLTREGAALLCFLTTTGSFLDTFLAAAMAPVGGIAPPSLLWSWHPRCLYEAPLAPTMDQTLVAVMVPHLPHQLPQHKQALRTPEAPKTFTPTNSPTVPQPRPEAPTQRGLFAVLLAPAPAAAAAVHHNTNTGAGSPGPTQHHCCTIHKF